MHPVYKVSLDNMTVCLEHPGGCRGQWSRTRHILQWLRFDSDLCHDVQTLVCYGIPGSGPLHFLSILSVLNFVCCTPQSPQKARYRQDKPCPIQRNSPSADCEKAHDWLTKLQQTETCFWIRAAYWFFITFPELRISLIISMTNGDKIFYTIETNP